MMVVMMVAVVMVMLAFGAKINGQIAGSSHLAC